MKEYMDSLKLFFESDMSYHDYLGFVVNKERFFYLISKYMKNAKYKNMVCKYEAMQKFYKNIFKRAEVVVNNLMEYNSEVLVLVAGGFYNDLILENLRNRNMNYFNIKPNFEKFKIDDKKLFLKRLEGKVFNYDYPIINSLIYSKEFRKEYFEILTQTFLDMYDKKEIRDDLVFNNLKYIGKVAIENDLMKKFGVFLDSLIKKGYKKSGDKLYSKKNLIIDLGMEGF